MSFIPWIEDNNVNATQDYNTYLNDSQRKEGFKGGTPASAIRVNTALRQANLVVASLMNALNVNDTLNYRSNLTSVENAILTGLKGIKVNNATIADYASEDTGKGKIENRLSNIETPMTSYNNSKGTIENRLENVETPLSSYNNSKGTIEERLTNLGFKEGNIIDSSNNIVGKIKRQGNYVLMNFTSSFVISNSSDKLFDISVSSSSGYDKTVFYPQDEQKRILHIQEGNGGMLFGFVEKNKNKPIRFSSTIGGSVAVTEYNSFGWEVPPIQ